MNYDELLRLATMGGGSGPDLGALSARASLPAPPAAVPLQPSAPVAVTPLATPASTSEAVLGPAGGLERTIGTLAPAGGVFGLLDILTGLARGGHFPSADAGKRRRLDKLEAELDQQSRQKQLTIEEENRQANRERERLARQYRLNTLGDRISAANARINVLSGLEQTPEVLLEAKQLAQARAGWENAQSRLLGEDALAAAPSPLQPSGGKRAGTDTEKKPSEGGYVQVLTDAGPRFMLAAEAARLGLPPANVRTTRVAQPSEREAASLDVAMLDQLNQVRQSFREGFTGPVSGRIGQGTQIVGGAKKGEPTFRQQVSAISNVLLKMRSGAAVTEQEYQRFKKEMPTPNDPYFQEKLESFWENLYNIARRRREVLEASGVDVSKFPALPEKLDWGTSRPDPNAPPGTPKKPAKEIRVVEIATGATGTIPESEFDPKIYRRIKN